MSGLVPFAARRILLMVPTILGIVALNFVLVRLAPGDVTTYIVGELGASPEYIQEVREELGLNQSIHIQLGHYLVALAQGDLGHSFMYRRPVSELVLSRAKNTLLLMVVQLVLATIAGVTIGVLAAARFGSVPDRMLGGGVLVAYSLPVFWLGQLLLLGFAVYLGWLPVSGMQSVRERYEGVRLVVDIARHMALPVLTLALTSVALIFRLTRAGMLEVLSKDFIRTARAKGVSESRVLLRHGLRNASIPVITVLGMSAGTLITGAALTETVFAWPGLGQLMIQSVAQRDYPVLSGIFIIVSVFVVVSNFATDVIYALLDPRIRLS